MLVQEMIAAADSLDVQMRMGCMTYMELNNLACRIRIWAKTLSEETPPRDNVVPFRPRVISNGVDVP